MLEAGYNIWGCVMNWSARLSLGAAAVLLLGLSSPVRADDTADAARIDKFLKQAGYNVTKKTDTVWVIQQHGDNLGDFKEILAVGDGLLVIFVTIARDADIPRTADLEYKMLQMNHQMDRIKVEIDDDGDAAVRSDVTVRTLDTAEFKEQVHQVAASADEVYGAMKPYLAPEQ